MKNIVRSLAVVGGCCVGLFTLPQVARSQGFYFDANAGVSIADDVKLNQFLVPTHGTKLELDPGSRIAVAGGYNFNEFVGAQLETGYIFNDVKGVNNGGSFDASLAHVPMLAEIVVRYDKPDCKWVPYAGGGAGGDVSVISLDDVPAPGGGVVDGSGSDVVFAWQAFAGVRYKFAANMSIGGGYKFFSANGATWDVNNTSGDIKSGTAQVHSFFADFSMTF